MASIGIRIERLSRKEIWSVPLMILAAWIFAFLSFFFDTVRLSNWSPYWVLIGIVTFAEVVGLVYLARITFLDKLLDAHPNRWANLVLAAVLGMIKNLTVAFLAWNLGLDADPLWAFRFVGGAGLGLSIFIVCGLALGSRAEHTALLRELHEVQTSLLNLRKSSKARLASANEALATQTRDLLLTKLDSIQNMVQPGDTAKAVDSLREFIHRDVRPLSESLSNKAAELVEPDSFELHKPARGQFFSSVVPVKKLIRVPVVSVAMVFSTLSIAYMVLGAPECNPSIIASLAAAPILLVAKSLIPAQLSMSRRRITFWFSGLACVAALPGFIVSVMTGLEPWQVILLALQFVFYPMSLMAFAYSESLDLDRVKYRAQVEEENRLLSHDQALFEQQLWLGRRAWQFVVHGTVQAALTAALTRLQADPNPEAHVLILVRQDLDRARQALLTSPARHVDLIEAFAQTQATWRGIVDININVTERAARSLSKNNDARLCVNEIVKEGISNAVRHGEAKTIWVEIDRQDDFNLSLKVQNDGLPLASQPSLGVGSRLIEELTTDWSLKSNPATGLTVFKANLPLQRSWS